MYTRSFTPKPKPGLIPIKHCPDCTIATECPGVLFMKRAYEIKFQDQQHTLPADADRMVSDTYEHIYNQAERLGCTTRNLFKTGLDEYAKMIDEVFPSRGKER
jgi:hypothetical protein